MAIDGARDARDYWKEGWELAGDCAKFYLASHLVKRVVEEVFPEMESSYKNALCIASSFLISRMSVAAIPILAVANLILFRKQSVETDDPMQDSFWVSLEKKDEIQECLRPQLTQLASAIGGLEKSHAAVIGCDDHELENLVQQLTLLPELEEWKTLKWTGSLINREGFLGAARYVRENPKTILYIPLGYLPAHFVEIIPPETYVIVGIPNYSLWDEIKSSDLIRYKEVQLKPLARLECFEVIEEWAESIDKPFDESALESAVELAFFLLNGNGHELSLAKDLIERATKTSASAWTTMDDVWTVFVDMYPLTLERERYSKHGKYALATDKDKYKSIEEIAQHMNKKFNISLPTRSPKKSDEISVPYFLDDLNEQSKSQEPFAVGNERRILELTGSLKGLDKTNAILIGAPGTGKTTLVESIAWMIEHGNIDESSIFYGKTIYSLDLNRMAAGTKWRGMNNERITELFTFLQGRNDVILFIDEIQQLVGAGAAHSNEMGSYAQLMKPYLLRDGIMVIGATTTGEYEKWIQTDTTSAFGRRFREVRISEPTEEECLLMMEHIIQSKRFKEAYPGVYFDEGALQLAVHLMGKVESRIGDPDKSKDFIEKLAGSLSSSEDKSINPTEVEKYFNALYKEEQLQDKELPMRT